MEPRPAPRPRNDEYGDVDVDGVSAVDAGFDDLDTSWQQWLAENCLRNCTPESMLLTMVQAGLDAERSRAAIRAMQQHPAVWAARRQQQLHRKLESMVANQHRVQALSGRYGTVEKRVTVSRDEFLERYVAGSRPLVLTGMTRDWPAMHRWSPRDLQQRFGHLEVEVQLDRSADASFEQNKVHHRRKVRLGTFVDQVLQGGSTNDYYLTASNENLRHPEFAPILQDIGTLPDFCIAADLLRSASFWFGPAGTLTPLHHDTLMLLHTQVVGRKRWRFISPLQTSMVYNHFEVYSPVDIDQPDLDRYPLFAQATILDVVVEPGETVFLPLGWWHQVTSLDVSMSLSFTNLDVPNQYTFDNPSLLNY